MNSRTSRLLRVNILFGTLAVLTLGLWAATWNPVKGFEISIYESVGVLPWVLLFVAFSLAVSLALVETARQNEHRTLPLYLVSAIFILAYLFLLPSVRYGLVYDRWDAWYHIGGVRDILQSGRIAPELNVYPALHLLAASLTRTLDLPIGPVFIYVLSGLGAIFPLFLYILARRVWDRPFDVAVTVLAGTVFLNVVYPVLKPQVFSMLFFPLFFYLYFRTRTGPQRPNYRILALVVIGVITLSHIVSGLMIAGGLLIIGLRNRTAASLARPGLSRPVSGVHTRSVPGSFVWFSWTVVISWIIYFVSSTYLTPLRSILDWDFQEFRYSLLLGDIGLSLQETVLLIGRSYGAEIIVLAIATIGLLALILWRGGETDHRSIHDLFDVFVFAAFSVLVLVLLDRAFAFAAFYHPDRFLRYVFVLLPVTLPAFVVYNRKRKARIIRALCTRRALIVGIGLAFVLSIPVVYPSPYVEFYNSQSADSELRGNEWLDRNNQGDAIIIAGDYQAAWVAARNGQTALVNSPVFFFGMSLPEPLDESVCRAEAPLLISITDFDIITLQRTGQSLRDSINSLVNSAAIDLIYETGSYSIFLKASRPTGNDGFMCDV